MAFKQQNMNLFSPIPMIGALDMIPSPDVVTAQILPASALTSMQQGDAVKLVAGSSGAILVDKQTGPTDAAVFGVVPYNTRKNLYKAGDIVEVARKGSYMYMQASAAIARGARVAITAGTTTTDPLVTTDATTGHFTVGIAIDVAAALGDLIRVSIDPLTNP